MTNLSQALVTITETDLLLRKTEKGEVKLNQTQRNEFKALIMESILKDLRAMEVVAEAEHTANGVAFEVTIETDNDLEVYSLPFVVDFKIPSLDTSIAAEHQGYVDYKAEVEQRKLDRKNKKTAQ